MKVLPILSLAISLSCGVSAQELNYEWHFTAGGVGQDEVLGSTVDQEGNSILVGNFEDSMVVDGTTYRADEFATDGFILKLDSEGNLLWIRELNVGPFNDIFPFDVTTDTDNSILLAGSFRGTVDADPSDQEFFLISELDDIYLSKLDAEGHLIWAQNIRASNSEERILDMEMDNEGMLYLGGYIDITPDHNNDVPFLMKFNPIDTSIEWNYAAATKGRVDGVNEVAVDGDHIYITGSFEGEGIFGTDPSNETKLDAGAGKDMFVVKFTKDRELVWAFNIGADLDNDDVVGRSIAVDSRGDVYIVGDYDGTIDFDPGLGVAVLDGFIRSFILKLSSNGEFQWVTDHDGLRGKKVLVNSSDQPFGLFESSGANGEGIIDIGKFSSMGDSLWNNQLGAESIFDVSTREMQFNGDESIFIAANFSGEFKYDPNSDQSVSPVDGDNDFIYIKLNQDAVSPSKLLPLPAPANLFPNPVSELLSMEFDQLQREIEIQILDVLGRQIYRQRILNVNLVKIPFNYPSGEYYVKYTIAEGKASIQKITKM